MALDYGSFEWPPSGGGGGGSGTVTTLSVVTANGFSGTVSNPTTTPAITLVGTLTGDITGHLNSTALTATTNATLTTLSALSLPYSQITGAPAAITALTGDGSASGPGSAALTLATVNTNTGSWGSASSVATFTVNGKGLITAASNTAIAISGSAVSGGTFGAVNGSALTNLSAANLSGVLPVGVTGGSGLSIAVSQLTGETLYSVLGNNTGSTAAPSAIQSIILGTPNFSDTGLGLQQTGTVTGYWQHVLQNLSAGTGASADFIVNNDQGTATTHFGDFGINSSAFTGTGSLAIAGATYLYSQNGDLVLGTNTSNAIHFVVNNGATDAMSISTAGVVSAPTLSGQMACWAAIGAF